MVRKCIIQDLVVSVELHLGLIPYALSLCPLSLLIVPYHLVLFLSRKVGVLVIAKSTRAPTLCIPNVGTYPTLLFIRIIRLKS